MSEKNKKKSLKSLKNIRTNLNQQPILPQTEDNNQNSMRLSVVFLVFSNLSHSIQHSFPTQSTLLNQPIS